MLMEHKQPTDTRAQFSQEASSGAMTEALVDVRGCDFSGLDLRKKRPLSSPAPAAGSRLGTRLEAASPGLGWKE
ncbi:uncharacterized protein HaLaN_30107, partial [Haematococcus lacustris]